jgi:D-amino-acid dehydrogenase
MSSPTRSPDVVVVGGGAVGAAAAHALARSGARVLVLERSLDGGGCSYGNAGLICPSHAVSLASLGAVRDGLRWMVRRDSPFYVRPRPSVLPWLGRFAVASLPARSARATVCLRALATASLRLHEELARAGLPTGFVRDGILAVFESQRLFEAARAGGGEALEPADARRLEPALSGRIAGALLHRGDAHCDPGAFTDALLAAAESHGAEVRRGAEVTRLRRSENRVACVETSDGSLSAGTVVLAAGAWTARLARQVGAYVPLEPAKGYHVEVAADRRQVRLPVYMEDARVIATPLTGRLRFSGTLELSGDGHRLDPVRVEALYRAGRRVLDLPRETKRVNVWQGLRPCTPDGLPAIGWADGVDNMLVATGHAMLGITLAPVSGEIVAALVAGAPTGHDIEPLRPSRFRTLFGRLRNAG